MYHRMYLRRCSMSSISEESETGDDDEQQLDVEYTIRDNEQHQLSTCTAVENCLGDLNTFKEEIREAYEELSTLERQARSKTISAPPPPPSPSSLSNHLKQLEPGDNDDANDLDILLARLYTLEQRLDQTEMFQNHNHHRLREENKYQQQKLPSNIVAQFDELDQALATLTNTLNNVEIEFVDSGNSSSSSGVSDLTNQRHIDKNDKYHNGEYDALNRQHDDEHFSDSGLSQSTDSISLPFVKQQTQQRTCSQISNASSVVSCDTLKNNSSMTTSVGENKIRTALEKMYEANIKKMFVKIYNEDQSTKNVLIDETMIIFDILLLLLHKYHLVPTLHYSIVENLPDLHMYRLLEDHQNLINDGITYWSRDTHNRICFQQHTNKYRLFSEPNEFFGKKQKINDSEVLNDYISSNTIVLPDDITSVLHVKDKNRKVWKKYVCILRQSGIYQIPKSSSSSSSSSSSTSKRDLVCLFKFDVNMQLYHGHNWVEIFRSPTQFGFALKHAHIQKKSNKYIHYLCATNRDEYHRWIDGIRIVLHGVQLYKNFQRMKQIVDDGPENLAHRVPTQHQFNFLTTTTTITTTSSSMHEAISTISLPIQNLTSELIPPLKPLDDDLEYTPTKQNFNSLDRLKLSSNPSKTNFTRSSSFHASLRRCTTIANGKSDEKLSRHVPSPSDSNGIALKRSKSSKEITSRSPRSKLSTKKEHNESNKTLSIPFINNCIQLDKTPIRSKPPLPKRPPPPIPLKISPSTRITIVDNHIYDSFQDSPSLPRSKQSDDEHRTVPIARLPPMRVTDL